MFKKRKSFISKFTGLINNHVRGAEQELEPFEEEEIVEEVLEPDGEETAENWIEEDTSEGQLAVDVSDNPNEIVIQSMVAGVRPDDIEVTINREMVTIRGKRERIKTTTKDNYFFQELYWGAFSRTIVLPEEVDVEESEAIHQHGLLTIRLPKIDKKKTQKLKVKNG
jgi:HSP20 family protein